MWLCYSQTGSAGICINMDIALTDSKVTREVYLVFSAFFFFQGVVVGGVLGCVIILRIRQLSLTQEIRFISRADFFFTSALPPV